jgi:hypothetical protein
MSRNAHEKSGYKPRKLPRCTKCKTEFVLIALQGADSVVSLEWECPKCHKTVPRDFMNEDPPTDFEAFLHKRCEEINGKQRKVIGSPN